MDRRKLLSWFGLGWLVSFLPSSLSGCTDAQSPTTSVPATTSPATTSPATTSPATTSPATTSPATSPAPTAASPSVAAAPAGNFKAIGTVAQLDKDGHLLSDKIAVVRDPKDSNKVLAVNATCTHKGCAVKWKSDKKHYVCPCHDAEFAADGAVLEGPAKTPLQHYAAKIEKGQVLVNI